MWFRVLPDSERLPYVWQRPLSPVMLHSIGKVVNLPVFEADYEVTLVHKYIPKIDKQATREDILTIARSNAPNNSDELVALSIGGKLVWTDTGGWLDDTAPAPVAAEGRTEKGR